MAGLGTCIILSLGGGSGGALALGVANKILMLENSTYSVISQKVLHQFYGKTQAMQKQAAEAIENNGA